jgi:hypothetical protein
MIVVSVFILQVQHRFFQSIFYLFPFQITLIVASVILSSCVVPTFSSVVCPDGESECPDNNTCCLMGNHKYGCCPLPNAVCCSDHSHCCPYGFKCNVASGSCYEEIQMNNDKTTIPATAIKVRWIHVLKL